MSGNIGWGGKYSGGSWSAGTLYSDDIDLPSGRKMANGSTKAMITALFAYVGGYGASRSITIHLGSAATKAFTVPAQPSDDGTGYKATNKVLVDGGTARFSVVGPSYGGLYFGHGGDGTTYGPAGYSRSGALGGAYSWIEAPAAPTMRSVTTGAGGKVTAFFEMTGDNGGASITGWYLQYADNASFTNATIVESSGTSVLTLNPGTKYWFRAAGGNAVTDEVGTYGPWSSALTATTVGLPSAPRTLTATNTPAQFNKVNLSWTAPTDTNGTITGYTIYRDGVKVGTTTGTGTTYQASGMSDNTQYAFTVRARNAYADSVSKTSVDSNSVSITTWGPPTAPRTLTAVASGSVAGKISLAWTAPSTTGSGGITRYSVYYSSGQLITTTTSTSYDVLNLGGGQRYDFYVRAWNAIADAVGTAGAASNTAGATVLGLPSAPTSPALATSTQVPGRLVLTWSQSGTVTGFNLYEIVNGAEVLVGHTSGLRSYTFDGLSNAAHSYVVRARNTYTDLTGDDGPASSIVSRTPGQSSTQALASGSVANEDSNVYNGDQVLTAVTSTSISYKKVSVDIPSSDASSGTLVNTSNIALNGSFVLVSTPTALTLTYAATTSDIPATAVGSGSVVDATNLALSGLKTVTASDENNARVSYAAVTPNLAKTSVPSGIVLNRTSTVFNTTGAVLADVTATTLTYGKTNADIAEILATGTVTNLTNDQVYNGVYNIDSVPKFDSVVYDKVNADLANADILDPGGDMYRQTSAGKLSIRYRSGWLG